MMLFDFGFLLCRWPNLGNSNSFSSDLRPNVNMYLQNGGIISYVDIKLSNISREVFKVVQDRSWLIVKIWDTSLLSYFKMLVMNFTTSPHGNHFTSPMESERADTLGKTSHISEPLNIGKIQDFSVLLKWFRICLLGIEDSRDCQWGLPGLFFEEIMSFLINLRSNSSHVIETRKGNHFDVIGVVVR